MTADNNRARVSLDEEDFIVVIELVKLRFAELVENGQQTSGDIRERNFKAAGNLWEIIKEMEMQLPRHRRPSEASKTILGPLRDWRAAVKALAPAEMLNVPMPKQAVA